jgi:hypothetical protein
MRARYFPYIKKIESIKDKRIQKMLAVIVLAILLAYPPLVNLFIEQTHAASLTSYSVNIGDSRAGVATYHNFQFNTPSTTAIKTITFQYCTTASGSCTAPTGMILTASPTLGTVSGIAGSGYSAAGSSGTCTGSGNSNCTITLTVTTPSAQTGGATVLVPVTIGITNPTVTNTTYFVRITTVDGSSATIDGPNSPAFAILTGTSVAVSATVDPNLTFSIASVNSGGTVNGATTTVTSTAGTVPFGTLVSGSSQIAAQDLTITTNAGSGYTITASHAATISGNPPLVAVNNVDNIDTFNDSGASNASPATWSAPAGSTADVDTGYFGYTTNDAALCTGTGNRFTSSGGNKWAGTTTIGQEVACSTTGVSSQTTRVGYQVQINSLQPAGSYAGTVILIATPTY